MASSNRTISSNSTYLSATSLQRSYRREGGGGGGGGGGEQKKVQSARRREELTHWES